VTGRDPVIYTNTNWWNPCTGNDTSFGNLPLDIATWGSAPTPLPAGWDYETFWQYTDNATVSGAGIVDGDVFNGSPANLATFATAGYRPPVGSFDSASSTTPTSISVAGWALDPTTTAPINADVYLDGVGTRLSANQSRPDVGAAYPGFGDLHGFAATMATTAGTHQVCVYALHSATGPNPSLGCRTVATNQAPIGSVDVASSPTPTSVMVHGWALDPDTTAPINADVYIDGIGTRLIANQSRPDVGAAYPGAGAQHGFDATLATTLGTHQVCVYGIDSASGQNTTLGCRTVNTIRPVGFNAISPTRVLDTRTGTGVPAGQLGAGSPLRWTLPNVAPGITAVQVNVTATNLQGAEASYISVCPGAQAASTCAGTSVLNPTTGVTTANELTVPIDAGGTITLLNSVGSVDLIGDVTGYLSGGFTASAPTRVLDTRVGTGAPTAPLGANTTITLTVPNLPAGTLAVVLNVTATNLRGAGGSFISVCPAALQPTSCQQTSGLNPAEGVTGANELTVPVAADGKIQLFNRAGSVDLLADVAGYLTSGFTAANPTRVLDTRSGTGAPSTQVTAGSPITLTVPNLPAGTTAVVVNVTAANLRGAGGSFVSVCPAAQSEASCTATSVLNPTTGATSTNELTVPVGPDGKIQLFNHDGAVDLIGDLAGYYT
jgi:hypothetical protein